MHATSLANALAAVRRPRHVLGLAILGLVAAVLLTPSTASASSHVSCPAGAVLWEGPDDPDPSGDWIMADNWSDDVPGEGDTACLPDLGVAYTVTMSSTSIEPVEAAVIAASDATLRIQSAGTNAVIALEASDSIVNAGTIDLHSTANPRPTALAAGVEIQNHGSIRVLGSAPGRHVLDAPLIDNHGHIDATASDGRIQILGRSDGSNGLYIRDGATFRSTDADVRVEVDLWGSAGDADTADRALALYVEPGGLLEVHGQFRRFASGTEAARLRRIVIEGEVRGGPTFATGNDLESADLRGANFTQGEPSFWFGPATTSAVASLYLPSVDDAPTGPALFLVVRQMDITGDIQDEQTLTIRRQVSVSPLATFAQDAVNEGSIELRSITTQSTGGATLGIADGSTLTNRGTLTAFPPDDSNNASPQRTVTGGTLVNEGAIDVRHGLWVESDLHQVAGGSIEIQPADPPGQSNPPTVRLRGSQNPFEGGSVSIAAERNLSVAWPATLILDGAQFTGDGDIRVHDEGRIGGVGAVDVPIRVENSTVAPGTSTGILGPLEDLALRASTLDLQLNGTDPGSGHDQIVAQALETVHPDWPDPNELNLSFGGEPQACDAFNVLIWSELTGDEQDGQTDLTIASVSGLADDQTAGLVTEDGHLWVVVAEDGIDPVSCLAEEPTPAPDPEPEPEPAPDPAPEPIVIVPIEPDPVEDEEIVELDATSDASEEVATELARTGGSAVSLIVVALGALALGSLLLRRRPEHPDGRLTG